MMDLATFIRCGVEPTIAKRFLPPVLGAWQRWGIVEPIEQAMFVAHAMVESLGFVRMEENLNWKTPERFDAFFSAVHGLDDAKALIAKGPKAIANRIYANRMGNGDELSGDGWKYRGRGPLQITGKDNYVRASIGCHRPYENMPELVGTPEDGCTAACWFWATQGCRAPALAGNVDAVTRRINPGMAGAQERREHYATAVLAFNL